MVHLEKRESLLKSPTQGNRGRRKFALKRARLVRGVEDPMYAQVQALISSTFGSDQNQRRQMLLSQSGVFAPALVGKARRTRKMGALLVVMCSALAVSRFRMFSHPFPQRLEDSIDQSHVP